ncbi:hypothetical protein HMPREF0262_00884 [Clostridium sp. ATCC 29733]|nr:hypothetical protein HMPREF0262_00884 [Clostridium sp. ATCC 29733]
MGALSNLPFGGFFLFCRRAVQFFSSISYILTCNPHKILTA